MSTFPKKCNTTLLVALMYSSLTLAQSVTYHHDPAVMNQFTVAETGIGNLQPDLYYTATHKKYRQTAAETNKQAQRIDFYYDVWRQIPMAEHIDSALSQRAKVELLGNIPDRMAHIGDIAWQAEKEKIETKQYLFKKNINQILFRGGSSQDYKYWTGIYNAIDCGLRAVRDAYMPNSQRKKQYLLIYKDLVMRNNELVDCMCYWNGLKQAVNYSEGKVTRHPKPGDIARSAYGRWKIAMAGGGGIAGGSGGGVSGGGISAE